MTMRWRLLCLLCWACCVPYLWLLQQALALKQGPSVWIVCAGAALPWALLAFWCNARAKRRG